MKLRELRRPSIKSGMGNWIYYISTMSYKQLAEYVKMPKEVKEVEETTALSQRIQRDLTKNVDSILEYIENQPDRFFNALVLAVFEGRPSWYPGVFEQNDERFSNIGLLVFSGEEKIFPVDGQHRLAAIKKYVETNEVNDEEEVPVIFVAHQNSESGNVRTRRLFTALNRYAKPVKESDNIALDEDDIVSITTRYLVEESNVFKDEKIAIQKTESMSSSDNDHFTNIISLNKCNDYLLSTFMDADADKALYRKYRQEDETIKAFEEYVEKFWMSFIAKHSDVKNFFEKGSETDIRGEKGGNLLFRPRGLCPYIEAISTIQMLEEDSSYDGIMEKLIDINFELDSSLWKDILWNGTISDPGRALMRDLFIYLYNPQLLTEKRRKAVISKFCEKKHIEENEAMDIFKKRGFDE